MESRVAGWLSRLLLLAGIAVLVACAGDPAAMAGAAPVSSEVRISANQPGRTIPRELFGTNIQWASRGDNILPNDTSTTFDRPIVDSIRDAGVTLLRFPGGTLSDTYIWRHGIGPRGSRRKGPNFVGQEEPSSFGTDELIKLSREVSAGLVLTVNFSITPEDAADWVEYMNGSTSTKMGRLRAENGVPDPVKVTYWEIGNEIYNPAEPGHVTGDEYARKFVAFAKAMKARDPSIKIGAVLEGTFSQAPWVYSAVVQKVVKAAAIMATWNETVMRVAGPNVDFAVVHLYAPFDKSGKNEDVKQRLWAASDVFAGNLLMVAALLDKYGATGAPIAITEYNSFFDPSWGRMDERIASSESGLYLALTMFEMMREPRVTVANHWSLLNNGVFGMLTIDKARTVTRRPSFDIFKELSRFAGARVLSTTDLGPRYAVKSKGNLPDLPSVSMVRSAAAVHRDGRIVMGLVNRSADRSVLARTTLDGASASRLQVRTYAAAGGKNAGWKPVTSSHVAPGRDGTFSLALPPQSVTFVETVAGGK
jgi:alpha-N-arabinofuranosidase